MDRGRPNKRAGDPPIKRVRSKEVAPTSEEQLAFDHLPQGVRPTQASKMLTTQEMEALRHQALGQVTRFEVLNFRDVEALSRVRYEPLSITSILLTRDLGASRPR